MVMWTAPTPRCAYSSRRAATAWPWAAARWATPALEGRPVPAPPTLAERFRVLQKHIYDMCEDKGEYVAMREARTHAAWYMRGLRGAARLRRECCALEHYEDLARVIDLAWQLQREGA